jgi:Putative lumazine-binding
MKGTASFVLVLSTLLAAGSAASARVQSPEQKSALASVQGLLDGLGRRDAAAMSRYLLAGGQATLMRDGKPLQLGFEQLTARLAKPGPESHEERIHDAWVQVDQNVAVVWAPFEFLIDGKVDHCGRDLMTLVKVDGQWLIAALSDYSRKNCTTLKP